MASYSVVNPSKKEPDLRENNDNIDIANAYNWYNYFHDTPKAREYTMHYLKDIKYPKDKMDALRQVSDKQFINNVGWNARILTLGGILPPDYVDRMMAKIEKMIAGAFMPEADAEEKATVNIQERVREKIVAYIASIEDEIDKQMRDPDHKFNMYEWLQKNEIKPQVARGIADYYIPLFNEYIDILGEGPVELKEAYNNTPKKNLIKTFKFIEAIVNDAETHSANVKKATRKPRQPKAKTSIQLVSKAKYKLADDKYKITSVRPVDIIGAEQLWVFNTKTRFLGIYKSGGPGGLSMKGTAITGYDEKESISKKLRKPETHLPIVSQTTKAKLAKLMDTITSKTKTLNGRINPDTILLRVIK